ncbi:MAG: GNAT family N-acetyltransferase [Acidobacteriaceae bacterium]|nr:GNAT family N-acetyltransferase [Acidobacteriaceae bacterium]
MHENTSRSEDEITIRSMTPSDAKEAAALSSELGYPVSAEVMEARLHQFATLQDHAVYVACLQGSVVGWIDIGAVYHLQSPPYGEIGGLIVSAHYQGRGIGRRLMQAAEQWIESRKLTKVLVRSHIKREAAHAFYLRQNFSRLKTQAVFTKSVRNSITQ